jgi:hypothetical protein
VLFRVTELSVNDESPAENNSLAAISGRAARNILLCIAKKDAFATAAA